MADQDSSIDTIIYRLNQMATSLEALADRVDTKYVRFDLFEASKQLAETERVQMAGRIEKLESRAEWLVRTVGGIIIAALLGLVLVGAKSLGGG